MGVLRRLCGRQHPAAPTQTVPCVWCDRPTPYGTCGPACDASYLVHLAARTRNPHIRRRLLHAADLAVRPR
jgi:hypothetical protein